MSNYKSCPRCGRKPKESMFSNWFWVYTCLKCGEKYCDDCGDGSGTKCPKCGSKDYGKYGKAYF